MLTRDKNHPTVSYCIVFVHCAFLLAVETPVRKRLQRMSDSAKSSGEGIEWPRTVLYLSVVSLWKQRNAFVAGSITSDSAKALSRFKGWASGKWRVGKSEREVCGRAMRRLRIQHIWGWMTLMKELVAVDFNSYTARLLAVMRNNDRPATITAVIAVSLM